VQLLMFGKVSGIHLLFSSVYTSMYQLKEVLETPHSVLICSVSEAFRVL
jgi:hypothetical protein